MRFNLLPNLSAAEKEAMGRYLVSLLDNERLSETTVRCPLVAGQIGLYIDNRAHSLAHGTWQLGDPYLYFGQDGRGNNNLPMLDRLGAIAAIIAACGLWTDEMVAKFGDAVSRIMLRSYNEMMHGLLTVQGTAPATGLAFSADRQQVAALLGEQYFLPNGQPVEVDDSWVIVQ